MSTAVLSNAAAVVSSRMAVLNDGQYVFVGFKTHKFRIKGETSDRQTFAPIFGRYENGNVTGLYLINRSDLVVKLFGIRLAGETLTPGQLPTEKNNIGDFVEFVTNIVNVEGLNPDARWMNVLFPQVKTKVLNVKATKFNGLSKTGKEYNAHVYDITVNNTAVFTPNPAVLMNLAQVRGWQPEDLHCLDGAPVTFQDSKGQTIVFDANGKLTSKLDANGNVVTA